MPAQVNSPLFTRKQLTRLIWPLLVEQLLSVLVGMVDVLMVSFVGEATVSGVSLVDSVNHLIIQVLFALTAGGTVVCARCIGAKDADGARRSAVQLLTITTAAMLVLAALFLTVGRSRPVQQNIRIEESEDKNEKYYDPKSGSPLCV